MFYGFPEWRHGTPDRTGTHGIFVSKQRKGIPVRAASGERAPYNAASGALKTAQGKADRQ